jgi:uncharacterized tellurite resistance protein B-like protein
MFNLIQRLFGPAPAPLPGTDADLALAALLVRVARTDRMYAVEEVERIDRILMARHGFGSFEAAAMRAEAEKLEAEAPDTVRFTRALKDVVALEDRMSLVVALWEVALADGTRDSNEDHELRLLSGLLGLTDVESAQARQRAKIG